MKTLFACVTYCLVFLSLSGCATNTAREATKHPPVTSKAILNAADEGNYDDVKYILDKNPKLVNTTDKNGYTPLLRACTLGTNAYSFAMPYSSVVELLLSRGADVNAKTKNGYTALHVLVAGWVQKTRLINQSRWQVSINGKSILENMKDTQIESLQHILKRSPVIDSKDDKGSTPLYWAAYFGLGDIAKYLVKAGADRSIKNNDGKSPADIAAEKGYKDIF